MEKYVTVIDEDGSFLEATYPRRARGLVKKGRARFIDEEETTICLIKQEDTQSCLSDIYFNYYIKLSEDAEMNNDLNNNNNNINEDLEKQIDSEIDKLVNDAINDAMNEKQETEDQIKNQVDTDALLKAIKDGLKESLGAANILAKKGYDSAKSGIKDIAHSVKDKISSMQEAAREAEEAAKEAEEAAREFEEKFEYNEASECENECECEDKCDCGCDEDQSEKHKEAKFDFKFDHKDGKFEGKFGPKEFKFDVKDFKFGNPDARPPKGDHRPDSYALTMDFITTRLDMVINNMSHLMEAVDAVRNMPVSDMGGQGDAERAKVIRATVELREQTNKDIIALLNRMYEDLMAPVRAQRRDSKEAVLDAHISKILDNDMDPEEKISLINTVSQIYNK